MQIVDKIGMGEYYLSVVGSLGFLLLRECDDGKEEAEPCDYWNGCCSSATGRVCRSRNYSHSRTYGGTDTYSYTYPNSCRDPNGNPDTDSYDDAHRGTHGNAPGSQHL